MVDQPDTLPLVQRLRAVNVHRFGAAEKWPEPRNPDGPEAADRIEALEAEVERLRTAVRTAASWFDEYERLHAAKGTLDGDVKARTNWDRSFALRAALEGETP